MFTDKKLFRQHLALKSDNLLCHLVIPMVVGPNQDNCYNLLNQAVTMVSLEALALHTFCAFWTGEEELEQKTFRTALIKDTGLLDEKFRMQRRLVHQVQCSVDHDGSGVVLKRAEMQQFLNAALTLVSKHLASKKIDPAEFAGELVEVYFAELSETIPEIREFYRQGEISSMIDMSQPALSAISDKAEPGAVDAAPAEDTQGGDASEELTMAQEAAKLHAELSDLLETKAFRSRVSNAAVERVQRAADFLSRIN